MALNTNNPTPPGCSKALKGCLVITTILLGLFIAAVFLATRIPSVRASGECMSNMQEVAAAISRYEDVEGRRPSDLKLLAKDYLEDRSVLRCPLDGSVGDTPSYAYNPKARGSGVMLECDRHKLMGQGLRFVVLGDGRFKQIVPSNNEAGNGPRK